MSLPVSLDVTWLEPTWLWALLVVPLGFWLEIWLRKLKIRHFSELSERPLWAKIIPEWDPTSGSRKILIRWLAIAFAIMALARPLWGSHEEKVPVVGLDLLFVLDVSSSMDVEDVVPSRLKKAKHAIRTIVERLRGDRAGIVAFAGSSALVSPLTSDPGYLYEMLESLGSHTIASQGTDIGAALEAATRALERGAVDQAQGGSETKPDANVPATKAVILLSDGENHEQDAIQGAERIASDGVRFYVLGIGTTQGGPVPEYGSSGDLEGYKKNTKGEAVTSHFNSEALEAVAKAGKGRYWTLSAGEGETDEILTDLGALERTEYLERRYLVREERFQIPLSFAILLLVIELFIPARRSANVLILAMTLLPVLVPASAQASDLDVYLNNEKAIEAYGNNKMDEAVKALGAAQSEAPDLAELQFNQGAVQFKREETALSAQTFERSAIQALENSDSALAAKAFYNLGLSAEKLGSTDKAAEAYIHGIKQAEKSEDEARLAQKMRERLVQLSEEEKQKQNQQKQDQQDQNTQPPPDAQPEPKPSPDQGDQQNDSSKPEPEKKQEFESQKMSQEDADRVMSELSSREKELWKELQKRRPRAESNSKDW